MATMYIELVDGKILNARVKQKTGPQSDFAGYTLLDGEIALVRSSPTGPVIQFKVGPGVFDDLDWSLPSPGAAQKADTSTVFPAGVPGLYIPTEDGTYEGVTVDLSAGYTQLIWDGATLTDVVFPIDLAGYVANSDLDVGKNLFNKADILDSIWVSIGSGYTYGATNSTRSSIRIPGIKPETYYTLQGMIAGAEGSGLAKGLRFEDAEGELISGYPIESPISTWQTPAGCYQVTFTVRNGDAPDYDKIQLEEGQTATAYEPYEIGGIEGYGLRDSIARETTSQVVYNRYTARFQLGGIAQANGVEVENAIRGRSIIPNPISTGTYDIKITSADGLGLQYVLGYFRGQFVERLTVTSGQFTVPSTIDGIRITVAKAGDDTITQGELDDTQVSVTESLSQDVGYRDILQSVNYNKIVNPFEGLTLSSLGDSITYGFIPRNYIGYPGQLASYAELTARRLGMTFVNHGISGTTLAALSVSSSDRNPFVYRYDAMPNDADIITVMGGANDIRNPRPLGVMGDTVETTFYGALDYLANGLLEKYRYDQGTKVGATKKIIFITPIRMLGYPGLADYAQAVKEVGEAYAIPVLDFYNLSGIDPERFRTLQGTETGYTDMYNPFITDGTHPTSEGHSMMSDVLVGFLKSIM